VPVGVISDNPDRHTNSSRLQADSCSLAGVARNDRISVPTSQILQMVVEWLMDAVVTMGAVDEISVFPMIRSRSLHQ